jgi:transcriptional regulator with XRE-family HTH domain
MRDFTKKCARNPQAAHVKVLEFTPYTQRPAELWIRYQVLPHLAPHLRFEIDEAMGGNKAPLTARMSYLQRFLDRRKLIEAWPKLTIAALAQELNMEKRWVSRYRRLEEGAQARTDILEKLAEARGIFIYERDLRKLSNSLSAFDAFICAYTALLSDIRECAEPPKGFPLSSGWIQFPKSCSNV